MIDEYMEIFNTIKNTLVAVSLPLKNINFTKLTSHLVFISPAQASDNDKLIETTILPAFNSTDTIKVKSNFSDEDYPIVKETRVYCIVNKYNELIKASSRFVYSSSIKSKPIYCLFLSKHDALDFLYKVAKSHPSSFKKSGLGVNSFSLKQYFDIVKKNRSNSDITLLNDLQEVEFFFRNAKKASGKFKYIVHKKVDIGKPISDVLAYRINPYDKENPFSNLVFLKLEEAIDFWKDISTTRNRRLTVELFPISPYLLENAIFTNDI